MNLEEIGLLSNKDLDQSLRVAREALNDQQLKFVDLMTKQELKQGPAAIEAGYAERSAYSTATRLLKNAKVSLVQQLERERLARVHHVDLNWLIRQHLDTLKDSRVVGRSGPDNTGATGALKEIAKLLDIYPDQKSTIEIVDKVDFTTLGDDYWGALVAYNHELIESPPSKH